MQIKVPRINKYHRYNWNFNGLIFLDVFASVDVAALSVNDASKEHLIFI